MMEPRTLIWNLASATKATHSLWRLEAARSRSTEEEFRA